MRWPWRRTPPVIVNGEIARAAKHRAEDRLVKQKARWPEIHKASDQFAAIVERALKGTR